MNVEISKLKRNVWIVVCTGDEKVVLLSESRPINSKYIRTISYRSPPMEVYEVHEAESFQWHREYDWLSNETSIRILE